MSSALAAIAALATLAGEIGGEEAGRTLAVGSLDPQAARLDQAAPGCGQTGAAHPGRGLRIGFEEHPPLLWREAGEHLVAEEGADGRDLEQDLLPEPFAPRGRRPPSPRAPAAGGDTSRRSPPAAPRPPADRAWKPVKRCQRSATSRASSSSSCGGTTTAGRPAVRRSAAKTRCCPGVSHSATKTACSAEQAPATKKRTRCCRAAASAARSSPSPRRSPGERPRARSPSAESSASSRAARPLPGQPQTWIRGSSRARSRRTSRSP